MTELNRTSLLRRRIFAVRRSPTRDEPRRAREEDHTAEVDEAEDQDGSVPAGGASQKGHVKGTLWSLSEAR